MYTSMDQEKAFMMTLDDVREEVYGYTMKNWASLPCLRCRNDSASDITISQEK